jgi:hypothetical protein
MAPEANKKKSIPAGQGWINVQRTRWNGTFFEVPFFTDLR